MPPADQTKLEQLFYPVAYRRRKGAETNNIRFAYYTSAATALDIINNDEVWLRNARLMNDYSEINHGQNCLHAVWMEKTIQARLVLLCEKFGPDVKEKIEQSFDEEQGVRANETFILCISEHNSSEIDEDTYGRLSMWRAYGGDTSVAFVFNSAPFFCEAHELKALLVPVEYGDVAQFRKLFDEFLEGLEGNAEMLQENFSADEFIDAICQSLLIATLSFKHPAFAEEREWRIVYQPIKDSSDYIEKEIRAVEGIPQLIYKIKLRNIPEIGFEGATLPEMLNKLIIGPTTEPYPIWASFKQLLHDKGVENAGKKVSVSGIPLRK